MRKCIEKIWYLQEELLPEKLIWALLRVYEDGTEEVLTYTGKIYKFPEKYTINNIEYEDSGEVWLNQEEYSRYEFLLEEKIMDSNFVPPVGDSDQILISQMYIEPRA